MEVGRLGPQISPRNRLTVHREFLLFIPTLSPNLRSILSYYSSSVALGPEGDASVIDENIEGLGRPAAPPFSLDTFCLILDLRESSLQYPDCILLEPRPQFGILAQSQKSADISERGTFPWDPGEGGEMDDLRDSLRAEQTEDPSVEFRLTDLLPPTGYFAAGGIAGAVSRTATAPLDRVKVYLIAQTSQTEETVRLLKAGRIIAAAKAAGQPLVLACNELWRMGGVRSLWAGKLAAYDTKGNS